MKDKGYDFIRVFATLIIIIYHFFTTYNGYVPEVIGGGYNLHLNLGGVGVAMFFMLSGALFIKKYRNKCEVGKFYKKRLIRIFIPHWISYIMVVLVYLIAFPERLVGVPFYSYLLSFFALDFFGQPLYEMGISTFWLVGAWFTTVILIIYLLFPLLRWLYVKHKAIGTILITAIFILNMKFEILTYGGGYFSITNGIMCFWMGMIIEDIKKYYDGWGFLAVIGALAMYFAVNPTELFGLHYFPNFIYSTLLFIAMSKMNFSTKFGDYVSKYNFELYLMHQRIFIIFIPIFLPYMTGTPQIIFFAFIMVIVICIFSYVVQYLTNKTLAISDKFLVKLKSRKRNEIVKA